MTSYERIKECFNKVLEAFSKYAASQTLNSKYELVSATKDLQFAIDDANRSEFLKNCVARLVAAHEDYVQSREDEIGPKHPFWLAAEALIKAFDDPYGDIPGDCRRVLVALWGSGEAVSDPNGNRIVQGGFKGAWRNWSRREDNSSRPNWKPNAAVWREFRNLKESMKADMAMPDRMVPTVADLVAQGLNDYQIATNYMKLTRNGAWDEAWVRHMKEHPELNTPETRMLGKREKDMSRVEWESFAEKLASNTRIQEIRRMLETGEEAKESRSSRYADEFSLSEFEPRQAFEELPGEWETLRVPVEVPVSDEAREYIRRERGIEIEEGATWHARKPEEGGITVEQRAVMLLDDHVDDGEITRQLNISGQKLGAIKRNADRIRETMPQLAEV